MADSDVSGLKKMMGDFLGKMESLETKLETVDRELSTVKHDQRHLHEKQPAFPGTLEELRLPEYDGTDDPDIWLHRFEIFFKLQRTEEDEKVCLAAFHMTSKAQIWYYGVERNNRGGDDGVPTPTTWPEFADSVRQRFSDPTRGNAYADLIRLRHTTGSVKEYREEFLGLVDRCNGLNELMQVVMFTNGLRDSLRAGVELRQPATLNDAAWIASVLEQQQEELGFEN